MKAIWNWLKAFQSRLKYYADIWHKDLEFEVKNKVFLRVSPLKGVVRFGKKRNLSPRYTGHYEIL